jgi:transcriptional regulator of acetoin/glycerol metabolism
LPASIGGAGSAGSDESEASALSTTALADLERMTIIRVVQQAGGDKALAGRMLGISRATLYRKLKQYQIPLRPAEKNLVETAS